MTDSPNPRKPRALRVTMPLALPMPEAVVIDRAIEVSKAKSRNEFVRVAAFEKAKRVLRAAGKSTAA
jgi:uncharacterized protein (DUF1778 family)